MENRPGAKKYSADQSCNRHMDAIQFCQSRSFGRLQPRLSWLAGLWTSREAVAIILHLGDSWQSRQIVFDVAAKFAGRLITVRRVLF